MSDNTYLDTFLSITIQPQLFSDQDLCESLRKCIGTWNDKFVVIIVFLRTFHLLHCLSMNENYHQLFQKLILLLFIEYPSTTLLLVDQIPVLSSYQVCINLLNFMQTLSESARSFLEPLHKRLIVLIVDQLNREISSKDKNAHVSFVISTMLRGDNYESLPPWLMIVLQAIDPRDDPNISENSENYMHFSAKLIHDLVAKSAIPILSHDEDELAVNHEQVFDTTNIVEHLNSYDKLGLVRKTLHQSREKCFANQHILPVAPSVVQRVQRPLLRIRRRPLRTPRRRARCMRNFIVNVQNLFFTHKKRRNHHNAGMEFHERFGPIKRDNYEKNVRSKNKDKQIVNFQRHHALEMLRKVERRATKRLLLKS